MQSSCPESLEFFELAGNYQNYSYEVTNLFDMSSYTNQIKNWFSITKNCILLENMIINTKSIALAIKSGSNAQKI